MTLKNWLDNSWLVPHTITPEEISNLLAISDRDLAACQLQQLPADWRFTIAYNAGLQAATAALAPQVTERRGTIITIVLSNRWNSPQRQAQNSLLLLTAFVRNATSAAMI